MGALKRVWPPALRAHVQFLLLEDHGDPTGEVHHVAEEGLEGEGLGMGRPAQAIFGDPLQQSPCGGHLLIEFGQQDFAHGHDNSGEGRHPGMEGAWVQRGSAFIGV